MMPNVLHTNTTVTGGNMSSELATFTESGRLQKRSDLFSLANIRHIGTHPLKNQIQGDVGKRAIRSPFDNLRFPQVINEGVSSSQGHSAVP
jgi:hypothetical protein